MSVSPEAMRGALAERSASAEGNEERMLMALSLYYRFANLIFDNTRLLGEGMHAPPRFTDYLDRCMTVPCGRSEYDQMADDD